MLQQTGTKKSLLCHITDRVIFPTPPDHKTQFNVNKVLRTTRSTLTFSRKFLFTMEHSPTYTVNTLTRAQRRRAWIRTRINTHTDTTSSHYYYYSPTEVLLALLSKYSRHLSWENRKQKLPTTNHQQQQQKQQQ